jgi:hypothetical protein
MGCSRRKIKRTRRGEQLISKIIKENKKGNV